MKSLPWICSQWSAREKYAIPRALHSNGQLAKLYTDIWIKPSSVLKVLPRATARYHRDLKDAPVEAFNLSMLMQQVVARRHKSSVEAAAFDLKVAKRLAFRKEERSCFFGYSYASLQSMTMARTLGHKTILGQINPGPAEAKIVVDEFKRFDNGKHSPHVPNEAYWDLWREEVAQADVVMVNSEWSKKLLVQDGMVPSKIKIVPLAYEGAAKGVTKYPRNKFDYRSPLQLLYLGGIGIRKGFHLLIEAMKQLQHEPVHLSVVGGLKGPNELLEHLPANVTIYGVVPGDRVGDFYRNADVFMFPTLSDGFGLTQLEAQSYGLPIVTTPYCAPVVEDGKNGKIMTDVSAKGIAETIKELIADPGRIFYWTTNAQLSQAYSLEQLSHNLQRLV